MTCLKQIILLTTTLFNVLFLNAQEINGYNPAISKAAAIKDLRLLQNVLYASHPAPFAFISKDSLDYYFDLTLNRLPDTTNERQLYVETRKLLHKVGCGHTTLLPSKTFTTRLKDLQKTLPGMQLKVIDSKLFFLKTNSADSSISPGSELISINENPSKKILADVRSMLSTDGDNLSHLDYQLGNNFNTWYYFLYGTSDYYSLVVKTPDGEIETHLLVDKKVSKMPAVQNNRIPFDTISKYKTLYLLKEKDQPAAALLGINSFSVNKQTRFYKTVFNYLNVSKVTNLVIDHRGNGGGNIIAASKLLRHLTSEKFNLKFGSNQRVIEKKYLAHSMMNGMMRKLFSLIPKKRAPGGERYHLIAVTPRSKNHFAGKVFVLTDGGTFSAAAYVAAILKHHANATTIGEETGGGEAGSNGMLQMKYTLPETKLRFYFQYYHFHHDINTTNKRSGIIPDYQLALSENSLSDINDYSWEAVKKIMQR